MTVLVLAVTLLRPQICGCG